MSYPGLVGYAHHAQASGEKLFDQIIFFVVEGGAAKVADRCRVIDRRSVFLRDEGASARFPNALGHDVHRPIERHLCPFFRPRRAILHFRFASGVRKQLVRRSAFGTKVALADGTFRIALDRDQFSILVINQLAAADSAVRANRARDLRIIGLGVQRARFLRHRFDAGAVLPLADLPHQRPFRKQGKH